MDQGAGYNSASDFYKDGDILVRLSLFREHHLQTWWCFFEIHQGRKVSNVIVSNVSAPNRVTSDVSKGRLYNIHLVLGLRSVGKGRDTGKTLTCC
jgi:hypothetical protein